MVTLGCGEWGFRNLPLEDHFRICQKLGFRVMEFGIGGGEIGRLPEEPQRPQVRELHAMSRAYGIETPFCCLENDFTLPDPVEHERALGRTLRAMVDAVRCGATHVRLFAGFTLIEQMTESIWQRMIAAFHECQRLAEAIGLTICIETHGAIRQVDDGCVHLHTVTTHPNGLRRLLSDLPRGVAFNWDPGNCKATDPSDRDCKLDLIVGRIRYCHLKDWLPRGNAWLAGAPGDGDLDFSRLLSRLDYRGVLLIEYEPTSDIEEGLERSLSHLGSLGARLATTDDLVATS